MSKGFDKYLHLWITSVEMCKEVCNHMIDEVDDAEIVMMQSNLKEIIAKLDEYRGKNGSR